MTGIALPFSIGEPLAIILIAMLADFVLGGLPVIGAILDIPQALLRSISGWFDRRLNRANRSPASRRLRGGVAAVALMAAAVALGYGLARLGRQLPNGWALEIALVAALLSQRRIMAQANRVRRFLKQTNLDAARAALSAGVRYDVARLDAHGLARGAVERIATAVCDGVVAPVFWYLAFGLPGIFAYRAINILAARVGGPAPSQGAFGQVAVAFDSLLNFLPAPASALIMALAALVVPGANPVRALSGSARGGFSQVRPSIGWPVGAIAGAFNLALAGPRHYGGVGVTASWLGNGRARAEAGDIGRAIYLQLVASVICGGLLAVLGVAWAGAA